MGQEVYLLVITILQFVDLLRMFSCHRKTCAERAVMAGRLLISVALAEPAERSILCQHCSANTLVPEKLKTLKLDICWFMSEVHLLTNPGQWEVMVLILPFGQTSYAKL